MASDVSSPPRVYGGETAEERRGRRRRALLDAAMKILGETGQAGLSVDALCREAGLNKRYFYESFESVDALLVALIREIADEATAAGIGAMKGSGDAAVRGAVSAFVEFVTDDPLRARLLLGSLVAGEPATQQRNAVLREFVARTAAGGRMAYGLGEDARLEPVAAMMVGGTGQAVLDWMDGRIGGGRDELVDDLVEYWLALAGTATKRAARRD